MPKKGCDIAKGIVEGQKFNKPGTLAGVVVPGKGGSMTYAAPSYTIPSSALRPAAAAAAAAAAAGTTPSNQVNGPATQPDHIQDFATQASLPGVGGSALTQGLGPMSQTLDDGLTGLSSLTGLAGLTQQQVGVLGGGGMFGATQGGALTQPGGAGTLSQVLYDGDAGR